MKIERTTIRLSLTLFVTLLLLLSAARATENGGSVWPVGAYSYGIASGVPRSGQTMVYEYTLFYSANELDDANGKKMPLDFKLRVAAVAIDISHNWGVKFLGGQLGSHIAIPYPYEQLHLGDTKSTDNNPSNINIVPLEIFNHKGMVHWLYELQIESAAPGYQKGAALNLGQHNIAFTPGLALTLTPWEGATNLNARIDYIINDADHATHYRSGNELFSQFGAQQRIPRHDMSVGLAGYYYLQTTSDSQFGAAAVSTNADGSKSLGYRGRVLDLGPQVTFPWGKHGAIIVKWDHDMLVQNKPRGNAFWFQFGIPFSYLHHSH